MVANSIPKGKRSHDLLNPLLICLKMTLEILNQLKGVIDFIDMQL